MKSFRKLSSSLKLKEQETRDSFAPYIRDIIISILYLVATLMFGTTFYFKNMYEDDLIGEHIKYTKDVDNETGRPKIFEFGVNYGFSRICIDGIKCHRVKTYLTGYPEWMTTMLLLAILGMLSSAISICYIWHAIAQPSFAILTNIMVFPSAAAYFELTSLIIYGLYMPVVHRALLEGQGLSHFSSPLQGVMYESKPDTKVGHISWGVYLGHAATTLTFLLGQVCLVSVWWRRTRCPTFWLGKAALPVSKRKISNQSGGKSKLQLPSLTIDMIYPLLLAVALIAIVISVLDAQWFVSDNIEGVAVWSGSHKIEELKLLADFIGIGLCVCGAGVLLLLLVWWCYMRKNRHRRTIMMIYSLVAAIINAATFDLILEFALYVPDLVKDDTLKIHFVIALLVCATACIHWANIQFLFSHSYSPVVIITPAASLYEKMYAPKHAL